MGESNILMGNKKLLSKYVTEKKITCKFHSSRGRTINIQEHRKDKFLRSLSNITELPPTDLTVRVRAIYVLFTVVSLDGSMVSSLIN